MNHDETYWRALAADAQDYAALAYSIARRHATEGAAQLARVYQNIAYETHLKALARLGLAAEERERTAPSVLWITHNPGAATVRPAHSDDYARLTKR
jgi:hypothetical protein